MSFFKSFSKRGQSSHKAIAALTIAEASALPSGESFTIFTRKINAATVIQSTSVVLSTARQARWDETLSFGCTLYDAKESIGFQSKKICIVLQSQSKKFIFAAVVDLAAGIAQIPYTSSLTISLHPIPNLSSSTLSALPVESVNQSGIGLIGLPVNQSVPDGSESSDGGIIRNASNLAALSTSPSFSNMSMASAQILPILRCMIRLQPGESKKYIESPGGNQDNLSETQSDFPPNYSRSNSISVSQATTFTGRDDLDSIHSYRSQKNKTTLPKLSSSMFSNESDDELNQLPPSRGNSVRNGASLRGSSGNKLPPSKLSGLFTESPSGAANTPPSHSSSYVSPSEFAIANANRFNSLQSKKNKKGGVSLSGVYPGASGAHSLPRNYHQPSASLDSDGRSRPTDVSKDGRSLSGTSGSGSAGSTSTTPGYNENAVSYPMGKTQYDTMSSASSGSQSHAAVPYTHSRQLSYSSQSQFHHQGNQGQSLETLTMEDILNPAIGASSHVHSRSNSQAGISPDIPVSYSRSGSVSILRNNTASLPNPNMNAYHNDDAQSTTSSVSRPLPSSTLPRKYQYDFGLRSQGNFSAVAGDDLHSSDHMLSFSSGHEHSMDKKRAATLPRTYGRSATTFSPERDPSAGYDQSLDEVDHFDASHHDYASQGGLTLEVDSTPYHSHAAHAFVSPTASAALQSQQYYRKKQNLSSMVSTSSTISQKDHDDTKATPQKQSTNRFTPTQLLVIATNVRIASHRRVLMSASVSVPTVRLASVETLTSYCLDAASPLQSTLSAPRHMRYVLPAWRVANTKSPVGPAPAIVLFRTLVHWRAFTTEMEWIINSVFSFYSKATLAAISAHATVGDPIAIARLARIPVQSHLPMIDSDIQSMSIHPSSTAADSSLQSSVTPFDVSAEIKASQSITDKIDSLSPLVKQFVRPHNNIYPLSLGHIAAQAATLSLLCRRVGIMIAREANLSASVGYFISNGWNKVVTLKPSAASAPLPSPLPSVLDKDSSLARFSRHMMMIVDEIAVYLLSHHLSRLEAIPWVMLFSDAALPSLSTHPLSDLDVSPNNESTKKKASPGFFRSLVNSMKEEVSTPTTPSSTLPIPAPSTLSTHSPRTPSPFVNACSPTNMIGMAGAGAGADSNAPTDEDDDENSIAYTTTLSLVKEILNDVLDSFNVVRQVDAAMSLYEALSLTDTEDDRVSTPYSLTSRAQRSASQTVSRSTFVKRSVQSDDELYNSTLAKVSDPDIDFVLPSVSSPTVTSHLGEVLPQSGLVEDRVDDGGRFGSNISVTSRSTQNIRRPSMIDNPSLQHTASCFQAIEGIRNSVFLAILRRIIERVVATVSQKQELCCLKVGLRLQVLSRELLSFSHSLYSSSQELRNTMESSIERVLSPLRELALLILSAKASFSPASFTLLPYSTMYSTLYYYNLNARNPQNMLEHADPIPEQVLHALMNNDSETERTNKQKLGSSGNLRQSLNRSKTSQTDDKDHDETVETSYEASSKETVFQAPTNKATQLQALRDSVQFIGKINEAHELLIQASTASPNSLRVGAFGSSSKPSVSSTFSHIPLSSLNVPGASSEGVNWGNDWIKLFDLESLLVRGESVKTFVGTDTLNFLRRPSMSSFVSLSKMNQEHVGVGGGKENQFYSQPSSMSERAGVDSKSNLVSIDPLCPIDHDDMVSSLLTQSCLSSPPSLVHSMSFTTLQESPIPEVFFVTEAMQSPQALCPVSPSSSEETPWGVPRMCATLRTQIAFLSSDDDITL